MNAELIKRHKSLYESEAEKCRAALEDLDNGYLMGEKVGSEVEWDECTAWWRGHYERSVKEFERLIAIADKRLAGTADRNDGNV